ncbi:16S rRNA (cytosine(1402)-N(4))-methyltransferase [bacterium AH-315-J04]|nr:16S rRNA (cytosine(1402)-N(4))-methyltransferase [bacterium AH-315-J04]
MPIFHQRAEGLLEKVPEILVEGGRFGVIAFHSVEDRPVKLDFRQRKTDGIYRILTKKPIVASAEERDANPRARSAKLRVVERLPAE